MSAVLKAVITGIRGRMGQVLVKLVHESEGWKVHRGTERPGSPAVGQDIGLLCNVGALNVSCAGGIEGALAGADVVIDFTSAEASVQHARVCAEQRVPLVTGSTGFTAEQRSTMSEFARVVPIVMSPNMSIGVNVVIEIAALLAARLGADFDVDILEAHHRQKKDAPSGTALRLAEEVSKVLSRRPEDIRTSRVGVIGERRHEEIGVQTLRGGDVVGEHTVFFFGEGERVELTHRASSRLHFARGALRAAKWVQGRKPGLYGMADVLS